MPILVECDRCQATVGAEVVGQSYTAEHPQDRLLYRYFFLRCPTCGDPMVAISMCLGDPDSTDGWEEPTRYLPRPARAQLTAFPKPIAAAYEEALKCYRAKAYTAAAVMCRKTLEGICEAHGLAERTLAASLQKMRQQGVIENRLYEWADALRISGNEAAHGVQFTLTAQDSRDVIEFTNALLEYVFTFRDRFEKFKERRKSADSARPTSA